MSPMIRGRKQNIYSNYWRYSNPKKVENGFKAHYQNFTQVSILRQESKTEPLMETQIEDENGFLGS